MAKDKRIRGKVDKAASPAVVRHRSRDQQYAEGNAIRDTCPRLSHADWKPPVNRANPIEILEASNRSIAVGRWPGHTPRPANRP
jgi:hypothetical protein